MAAFTDRLAELKGLTESNDSAKLVSLINAENGWKNLPGFTKWLAEVAVLTGKGAETTTSAAALNAFAALAENCIVAAEPYLCRYLPLMLQAAGSKQAPVRAAAEAAVTKTFGNMSAHASRGVFGYLFSASDIEMNWQTRVLALKMIASLGDHAPDQLGHGLPRVVPEVTKSMSDTKPQVKEAAHSAMIASCDVIGNRDIEHMTEHIVRSITHPEETPELMHELAGVRFVQSVQSPALAMVVPLLLRGLRSRVTATRRQSAVIIDNMSKLVDDPMDAAPFLPVLLPALAEAAEAMSDPEARGVAEHATAQLKKLNEYCEKAKRVAKHADDNVVKEMLQKIVPAVSGVDTDVYITHTASLCCSLMDLRKFAEDDWEDVRKSLCVSLSKDAVAAATEKLRVECKEMMKSAPVEEDDDDPAEILCNCQFTLAYGTKILLHNTVMKLKRGAKYGLLGGNDSGKTSLMRAIANGSLEGFPDASTVRTVFVEADILGELSHLSCIDYLMQDPRLSGFDRNEVLGVMATVGFTNDGKARPHNPVSSLSGGWRMKLALARAMLQQADILLLDEPTNHLDVINVAWVKSYIKSLKNVTAVMVSHDKAFLNECCTDIIQIERLKLKQYKGNLDSYLEQNPDAGGGFKQLKEAKLKFRFPQPGPIEGVKSRSKALMKMAHCDFTYPGNTVPTLFDITVQVSMASRVGCVGENGAGKSTMIKVLTGEVVPQTGDVWKHPNARVAYVAQHAFHHIESHLNKTPNEYIRWRYSNGEDKESLVKISMALTEDELKLQREPFEILWKDDEGKQQKANKVVIELTGSRRESKQKEYEYEVKFRNDSAEMYLGFRALQRRGWEKACKAVDARIAQRSGMYIRTLSSANVENHLNDCGLEPEFATHYRMSALSGGQKVKVVIAAAMWMQPHILILDEPTNYLDRESLGALAKAIEAYEGGVVIISHNNEFVSTLCPEEWVMDAGHLTTRGEVGWMSRQDDKISDTPVITEMTDALGNTSEVKAAKKTLSKREEKAMLKVLRKKITDGEALDEDEEEIAIANNLL
eukprot:gene2265-4408_t